MIRQRTYRLATVVGLVLLLSACSNLRVSDPTGMFGSDRLVPQAGDPCASERAAFSSSQSYFGANLVSDTMMGSMKSVASNLAGRIGSGSTTNLTRGLGPTAFRGAQAGYLSSIAKRSSGNEAEMVQQMSSDLRRENEQVDKLHGSFERLQSCRFQQAGLIKTRARSGRLMPDEAREELGVERRLFDEELAKARQSGSNMENRDEQFQYAAQELNRPGAAPAVSVQTKHAADVTNVTLPRKRDAFVSAVSDAEVRSKGDLGDNISAS